MEFRELRAFVAVVDEGGFSPAARRLHLSQSALSQTVGALERHLGVPLLTRTRAKVEPTEAGRALLDEARALIAHHDRTVASAHRFTDPDNAALRLGVPLELPARALPDALARLAVEHPETSVHARHLSSSAQLAALHSGELDLALMRERPAGREFDAELVFQERLGVLAATRKLAPIAEPDGIRLELLTGLSWIGFPRTDSPAWFDEVTAVLRGHGIDLGRPAPDDQPLIADVKMVGVQDGHAFTLAPPQWSQPLPEGTSWWPLIGAPLLRRTWAVWSSHSRRRDLGFLVSAFDKFGLSSR